MWLPVCVVLLALSPVAWTQTRDYNGLPYYGSPSIGTNQESLKTAGQMQVEGIVNGLSTYQPYAGAAEVLRIGVRLDSGRFLTVQVCPEAMSDPNVSQLRVGDRIKVTGTMTELSGIPMIMSCNVQLESASYAQPGQESPPVPSYPYSSIPDYSSGEVYPYSSPWMDYYAYPAYPVLGYPTWWWGGFGVNFRDGDFDRDDFFRHHHFGDRVFDSGRFHGGELNRGVDGRGRSNTQHSRVTGKSSVVLPSRTTPTWTNHGTAPAWHRTSSTRLIPGTTSMPTWRTTPSWHAAPVWHAAPSWHASPSMPAAHRATSGFARHR